MIISDNRVQTHFLSIKDYLDQVIYSLLRTEDHDMADELFIRIKEGEATFTQMARMFSEEHQANTEGIIGPVCHQKAHPVIAARLRGTSIGRIMKPFWFKQLSVIMRVNDFIGARYFDHKDMIRQHLEEAVIAPA